MSRLQIYLFGSPTLMLDGQTIVFDRWKAVALLAYLVLEPRPHRRDALATLFWPELSQARARGGLRRVLNALQHALGKAWLQITRETVQINCTADLEVDVWRLREALAPLPRSEIPSLETLQQAIALYRDDLLTGFTLRDAPAFEDWRYFAAEELRQLMTHALKTLLEMQRTDGAIDNALSTARHWLALDPLAEEAHQALIRLHLAAGDRSAALRQYEHCTQLLKQELGVAPSAGTQALLTELQSQPESTPQRRAGWKTKAQTATLLPSEKTATWDEVRQVVVLNLGIIAGPDDVRNAAQRQPMEDFLALASATLTRYAAYVEYMGPEGGLALFGLPYGHEDDAERAVHVALTLAQAAQPMQIQLAAGIKIGLVQVTSATEASEPHVMRVLGAVLGQAAELQRAAALGQILVDGAIYRHSHLSFTYAETKVTLRGQRLQGVQKSAVYCVLQPTAQVQKTRGIPGLSAHLIGRNAELTALEVALQRLMTGQGQTVLLVGEAGIGKSRLVAELWQRRPTPCLWLEGRCLEMTTAASYGPFLQALRTYFGAYPGNDAVSRMRTGLQNLLDAQRLSLEAYAEIGAVLGKLFSVYFHNAWDQRLENATPAEARYRTMTALRTLLTAVAHTQPLILVLEDLHWADDASLDLLNDLLPVAQTTPLLLLCVYRPIPEQRCMQLPLLATRRCPAAYQEITLRELTPDQNQQMLEALLAAEALLPKTKAWILERAQGNPYFTEEVILALIEGGFIKRQAGVWQTDVGVTNDLENVELPYSIDRLILSRFDRLKPALRHTLEAAAILGRTFLLPLLRAVIAEPESAMAAITELETRGFIYCEQREPVAEFSFRHVLAQAAIYQTLTGARRSELHLRAAQAIERQYADKLATQVETLAYHYVYTDDHGKAAHYLGAAGAKARRAFANESAIAYFRQALAHLGQISVAAPSAASALIWSEVWGQLGRTYHATGRYQLAEQAFHEAITQAEVAHLPAPAIVRLIHWLGEALYWQNKYTELRDSSLAGLALLPVETPSIEQILMLSHLNSAYWSLDEMEASRAAARQVIPLIAQFPLIEELWPAYHTVIDYFKDTKELNQALAWIEILRAKAAERQELMSLAKAVLLQGSTLSEQGNLHAAGPALQEALTLSQTVGEMVFQYHCLHRFAINALLLGEKATAWHYVDELLALMRTVEPAMPDQYAFCGYILFGTGQTERGLALLTQAFADCQTTGTAPTLEQRLWLGQALAAVGRHTEARHHFEQLLATTKGDRHLVPDYPDLHPTFPAAVAALDRLLAEPAAFQYYGAQVQRGLHDRSVSAFRYWHPVPVEIADKDSETVSALVRDDELAAWQWSDPLGDGAYQIDHGLDIAAADARDLWVINLSAPSLRTPVTGDFVLEATCTRSSLRSTTMGGLLLWRSPQDFIRLDWGGLGAGEVSCLGCCATQETFWGRGRTDCPQPLLRLERRGDQVRALFSEDGEQWWLVGEVVFAAGGVWEVGFYAQGLIDRMLYPQASAGGGGVRFEAICLTKLQRI